MTKKAPDVWRPLPRAIPSKEQQIAAKNMYNDVGSIKDSTRMIMRFSLVNAALIDSLNINRDDDSKRAAVREIIMPHTAALFAPIDLPAPSSFDTRVDMAEKIEPSIILQGISIVAPRAIADKPSLFVETSSLTLPAINAVISAAHHSIATIVWGDAQEKQALINLMF